MNRRRTSIAFVALACIALLLTTCGGESRFAKERDTCDAYLDLLGKIFDGQDHDPGEPAFVSSAENIIRLARESGNPDLIAEAEMLRGATFDDWLSRSFLLHEHCKRILSIE